MKKVRTRAMSALFIALAVVIGLAYYFVLLADSGGDWATYFSSSMPAGTITDRDGVVLYDSDGTVYNLAEDYSTRLSTFHLVGDIHGNVGTGALSVYKDALTGYSFIGGTSSGETLELTVDADLNVVAFNALGGRQGAVMVSNYETGEVLAMVSSPTIDMQNPPSVVPDGAYINKALSASYVPGSVYKLVTLAAAIDYLPDLYERTFACGGSVDIGTGTITCTGTHGYQNIEQALANSCNVVFGELSVLLGTEIMTEYSEKFGFTSEGTLDGTETATGSFESGEEGSSDLAWAGIGQHRNLVNPYSMLCYVSAIANGGVLKEPTLTESPVFGTETVLLDETTADKIASMMSFNVEYAYGGDYSFPDISLAAKTGTAEVGDGTSHAWMTGFLTDEDTPYAIVVIVEHAGGGLANAGPIVNTVLQAAVNADY